MNDDDILINYTNIYNMQTTIISMQTLRCMKISYGVQSGEKISKIKPKKLHWKLHIKLTPIGNSYYKTEG